MGKSTFTKFFLEKNTKRIYKVLNSLEKEESINIAKGSMCPI